MADETRQSLARRAVLLALEQGFRYVAFAINLPTAVSLLFLVSMIALVLDVVYGFQVWDPTMHWLAPGADVPGGRPVVFAELFRVYSLVSLGLFLIGEVSAAVLRLEPMTVWQRMLMLFTVLTLGWSLVMVHAPFFGILSDFVGFVITLYVVGAMGCAFGAVVTHVLDRFVQLVMEGLLAALSAQSAVSREP